MNLNTSKPKSKSLFQENTDILQDLDQNTQIHQKKLNSEYSEKEMFNDIDREEEIFEFNEEIDVPEKVIETYKSDKGKLFLKIKFKQRSNGIFPIDKVFPSDYLRNRFPYFLIEFYESKITSN